jgi:hypothetical protein
MDHSDQYQRQPRTIDSRSKGTNTPKGKGKGQSYGRGGGHYGKGFRSANNSQSNDI